MKKQDLRTFGLGAAMEAKRRALEARVELSGAPKMLPMLPQRPQVAARPVDPKWTCQRSGDCCMKPPELVMTKEEAAVMVHHAPPTITLHFRPVDETFVAMKAGPCPLYVFKTCLVYEHRPYNCRRFGCMRPDVTNEPFEADGSNFWARVNTSRVAKRLAEKMQRKAQRWARNHGWKVDNETVPADSPAPPAADTGTGSDPCV